MIRSVKISDAKMLLELMYKLDNETKFMMLEPCERSTTLAQQQDIIQSFLASQTKVMLVVEIDQKVVGFVAGIGNTTNRNKHAMHCVMGIQHGHCGQGLGAQLLNQLESWASDHHFTRIELTVMAHNKRAIKLYNGHGFEVEGTERNSLLVDGEYISELYMSKLLM